MEQREIGIVGAGRMGGNIARRLREVGQRVASVHDQDHALRDALAEEIGARAATSPKEVADTSDVVLTAVSDEASMEEIYREGAGLLEGGRATLFINTATIPPQVHIEVARRARLRGRESLEACLLGTVPHARAGTLYVLAAGDEQTFMRAKPLLEGISSFLRYVGAAGEAAKIKAIVNMVMDINVAGAAEGLGLGAALGIPSEVLVDALSHSAAASRALETHAKAMLDGAYGRFLTADYAAKDARIALDLALEAGAFLPLASAARGQFERMGEVGLGKEDLSAVAQLTFPGRQGGPRPR